MKQSQAIAKFLKTGKESRKSGKARHKKAYTEKKRQRAYCEDKYVKETFYSKRPPPDKRRKLKIYLWRAADGDESKYVNCHYCQIEMTFRQATIDHKRPVSKGGKTNRKNCLLACERCNKEKSDMNYAEYINLISARLDK